MILDVVYNHLGPSGNFFREFARAYFADEATEWGDAINFDGPCSGPVREFFLQNIAYWIRDYHFDGLRFDALQAIQDSSAITSFQRWHERRGRPPRRAGSSWSANTKRSASSGCATIAPGSMAWMRCGTTTGTMPRWCV